MGNIRKILENTPADSQKRSGGFGAPKSEGQKHLADCRVLLISLVEGSVPVWLADVYDVLRASCKKITTIPIVAIDQVVEATITSDIIIVPFYPGQEPMWSNLVKRLRSINVNAYIVLAATDPKSVPQGITDLVFYKNRELEVDLIKNMLASPALGKQSG